MIAAPTTEASQFLAQFLKKYQIDAETVALIQSKLLTINLHRGDKFCEKGQICDKVGILMSGLLYAGFCPNDSIDEEVSRFFYFPVNAVVTSFESFSQSKPTTESITALEDSFLFCIKKRDLDQIYQLSPAMTHLGREIAELSYIQASQRIRVLQTLKAKDRILDFRKNHPALVNHPKIHIQHIASYLGMNRNLYTKLANEC